MMDRNRANVLLALMVSAIAEHPEGLPDGHLYAALMPHGVSLADHVCLTGLLADGGMIENEGHLLALTSKGRELAESIKAHVEAKGVPQ